jgi:hypothetical protein
MMEITIHRSGRVVCDAVIALPLPTTAVWGQLRDFPSAACHDPFHCDVRIVDGVPRAGAKILLGHRYFFFRASRVGRLLRWEEGVGFAFSDLNRRDPRRAFPHVLSYELEPADVGCRLRVRVTGRWTAAVPRWAGRLWLRWVFGHVVRTVENQLLRYAVVYRRRKLMPAGV